MATLALLGDYATRNFGDLLIADRLAHSARKSGANIIRVEGATAELRQSTGIDRLRWWNLGSCDRAVFGGGGYFNDASTDRVARFKRFTQLTRRFQKSGIPYAIIGTGAGPMQTPEGSKYLKEICDGAKTICMRDPESRDLLVQAGVDPQRVSVTGDWAAELTPEDIPPAATESAARLLPPDDGRPLIGLHLLPFSRSTELATSLLQLVHDALKARPDAQICWIFENRDRRLPKVLRAAQGYPRDLLVLPRQPYWVTAALLQRMNLVVTSQLHVGIVAWALGVPVCGFSTHPKTKRFFNQIGRARFQIDQQENLSPIRDWLEAWCTNPADFADCPHARQQTLQSAAANHTALAQLLN
jgi:polysaccharide pyruvyl transferase WcaK-like protein